MEKDFIFLGSERKSVFLKEELQKSVALIKEHIATTDSITIRCLRIVPLTSEEGIDNAEVILSSHKCDDLDDEFFDVIQGEFNEFRFNDFFLLSEALHKFSDDCESGKSLIHIIWCIESYVPCPSEVVEFYGALQRLQLWFNASLTFVVKDAAIVEDWISSISFDIVPSATKVVYQCLRHCWRGNLGLTFEDTDEPHLYPEISLTFQNKQFNPFSLSDNKFANGVYVLPVAEVFSQVDIGTIHLTNIQPGSICFFEATNDCDEEQKSVISKIFAQFATPGIGTLVRIRYACEPPNFGGVSSLKTNKWKQTVIDGHDGSLSSFYFKGFHLSATFLLLPEGIEEGKAYAFLLQDSSAIGDDIMTLALQEFNKAPIVKDPAKREVVVNLLKDTPLFNNVHMVTLGKLLYHLPKELKLHLEKKGQNVDSLYDAIKNQLEVTSNQELFQHLMMFPFSSFDLVPTKKIKPEYEAPMSTWPEYQALVEAEKTKKQSLDCCQSGDFLGGLPPPPSIDSIVYLDADQLVKIFTSDGEPTDDIKSKMQKFTQKRLMHFKASLSLEHIKSAPWSEAFHLRHHGIYYNRNYEDEKFETSSNCMRERYIRHETASTCSLYQEKESSYVTLNPKSLKPNKTKVPVKHNRTQIHASKLPSKLGLGDLKFKESVSKKTRKNSKKAPIPSLMLRRSPRKKTSTKPADIVKASDLLKEPSTRPYRSVVQKTPKPADLSEIHKQKLRNAVMSALETEGIGMKHELFKLCFKKLFTLCKPFVLEIVGKGSTSSHMVKIAKNHVKQVIEFEKLIAKKR